MNVIKKFIATALIVLFVTAGGLTAFAAAKINLNTAPAAQLVEVKGIGDKMAQRIIDYRKQHKFKTLKDLLNVKGVGEKTYKKISPFLTVGQSKAKAKK